MVDEETAHRGLGRTAGFQAARDAFYKGDIAEALVRHQECDGGLMTREDLAAFRAEIEPPCHTTFHGPDI